MRIACNNYSSISLIKPNRYKLILYKVFVSFYLRWKDCASTVCRVPYGYVSMLLSHLNV